jgi:ATP:ADP antiporter, AAA family
MISGIVKFFYPDIHKDDIKKAGLLGLTFFFIVGAYWLLRLLKDLFFYNSLAFPVSLGWHEDSGRQAIPTAKFWSPFVVLGCVVIYTKLIDMFEKYKLFYIIVGFYILAFSGITGIMLAQAQYGDAFVGKSLLLITGYAAYWLTESFGSVLVAFFWSFTVSSTPSDQAKRTFPFIVALGQLGSISCSSLLFLPGSAWVKFSIAIGMLVGVFLTVRYMIKTIPADQMKSDKEEKKTKPDMLSGIKLLLTEPYFMGVLVVSTFYEIAGTIVDYQMKSQAKLAGINFEWFQGVFGTSVNVLSFVIALLGTSALMKKFGIRVCLIIYPASFAFMLTGLYIYYQSGMSTPTMLAWAAFSVMLVVKAASYAVNNPIKDMMYIPTSKDAKFKVKGIIDMLGGRSAKGTGAAIAGKFNVMGNPAASMHNLFLYGSLVGLGIIGVWIAAALYVGKKNQKLVRNNEILG